MLCQKCGLQEAVVHLESTVFRQKIEEHLCSLCAGARAHSESDKKRSVNRPFDSLTSHVLPPRPDPAVTAGSQEKILKLLRLSKQQGYLTFDDLQRELPDSPDQSREIDFILSALHAMGIEVLESKQPAQPPLSPPPPTSDQIHPTDPVQHYLDHYASLRRLTAAQEIAFFKQAEKSQKQANAAFFQLPGVAAYFVALGAKILRDEQTFERVVLPSARRNRAAYLEALPRLIASTQKLYLAFIAAWRKAHTTKTSAQQKQAGATLRRRAAALRARLPEFHFTVRAHDEYLAELQPLIEEIATLLAQPAPRSRSKSEPAAPGNAQLRLDQIEAEHQLAPARLVKLAKEAAEHSADAHRTRLKVFEANLPLVISIVKNYLHRGVPFVTLLKAGYAGLMQAVRDFDRRQHSAFSTQATWSIIAAVNRAIP